MTNENEKSDITVPEKVSDTKTCPGGKITCPQSDNTCCQDGKGGYYCSPYKNVSCDFHFFLLLSLSPAMRKFGLFQYMNNKG